MICPLCGSGSHSLYYQERRRDYFECSDCSLIFVPRTQLISVEAEKQRYDFHENDEMDARYLQYLKDIAEKIIPELQSPASGLDFGCGRTKLFEKILQEKGIHTESFDLYFWPDQGLLVKKYDFVLMIEVIEHLRNPDQEMKRIKDLFQNKGKLFIKTKLVPESKALFSDWFYKRDQTHIQFFSEKSLNYLKEKLGFQKMVCLSEDLFLLTDE